MIVSHTNSNGIKISLEIPDQLFVKAESEEHIRKVLISTAPKIIDSFLNVIADDIWWIFFGPYKELASVSVLNFVAALSEFEKRKVEMPELIESSGGPINLVKLYAELFVEASGNPEVTRDLLKKSQEEINLELGVFGKAINDILSNTGEEDSD